MFTSDQTSNRLVELCKFTKTEKNIVSFKIQNQDTVHLF